MVHTVCVGAMEPDHFISTLLHTLGYNSLDELKADLKTAGEVRQCRQTWKKWLLDTMKDVLKICIIAALSSIGYALIRGYGL